MINEIVHSTLIYHYCFAMRAIFLGEIVGSNIGNNLAWTCPRACLWQCLPPSLFTSIKKMALSSSTRLSTQGAMASLSIKNMATFLHPSSTRRESSLTSSSPRGGRPTDFTTHCAYLRGKLDSQQVPSLVYTCTQCHYDVVLVLPRLHRKFIRVKEIGCSFTRGYCVL